jgi:hypothetical protein
MSAGLTDEEHEARAMLLGAVYKSWLNAYVWEGQVPERWVDADTMCELDHHEKFMRLAQSVWGTS